MTDYGQSIAPKWFQDQSVKALSKIALARYLHRALMAVGMLPIRLFNHLGDFEQNAFDEYPVTRFDTTISHPFWFYDYPSSETFVVDGLPYRPCFAMVALIFSTGTTPNNIVGENIGFHHFYRRADIHSPNSLWNLSRLHITSNNLGLGNYNDFQTNPWQGNDGARVQLWNWEPYAGGGDANHQLRLNVQNVQIVLGKGGLLVQMGSGKSKSDANNYINVLAAFGGARIPGRARIPVNDLNLNRVDPVIWFDFNTVDTTHYYQTSGSLTNLSWSGARVQSYSLAAQHDLLATQSAVRMMPFNLENVERPLFPIFEDVTKNSPRDLAGSGSHILNRLVYTLWNLFGSTSVFYGPTDQSIRIEPIPAWEDLWTFPGFRVADNTAPMGEFVDPNTNLNWLLFRAANLQCMFAVDVEGATKLTALPAPGSYVQTNDYTLTINTAFAATPNTLTLTMVPSGSFAWVAVPANNEMTATTASTGAIVATMTIDISGFETEQPDAAFDLYFDAFAKNSAGAAPTPFAGAIKVICPLVSLDTTDVVLGAIPNAGNDNLNPSFAYASYGPFRITRRGAGTVRIKITAEGFSTAGTKTFGVKNLHLKRTTR